MSPSPASIPIAVTDIQTIIFHLKERGIGVLITDHNVRETLRITDRAYIVHDGAVFKKGTPGGSRERRGSQANLFGCRFSFRLKSDLKPLVLKNRRLGVDSLGNVSR